MLIKYSEKCSFLGINNYDNNLLRVIFKPLQICVIFYIIPLMKITLFHSYHCSVLIDIIWIIPTYQI